VLVWEEKLRGKKKKEIVPNVDLFKLFHKLYNTRKPTETASNEAIRWYC
jgi:hypothetical protein